MAVVTQPCEYTKNVLKYIFRQVNSMDSNTANYSKVNIQGNLWLFIIFHHENFKPAKLSAHSGKFCAHALDLHDAAAANVCIEELNGNFEKLFWVVWTQSGWFVGGEQSTWT